jgi:predicted metal-dependent peptidase
MNQKHQDALDKVVRARSALIKNHPFFGFLAMQLRIVITDRVETMATDGRHLFCNPDWTLALNDLQCEGVIAHEIYHCVAKHHVRRGERDHLEWNVACDYAINPMLRFSGFVLPDEMLHDPQFDRLGAEDIYRLREQQKQDQQQQQSSQSQESQDGDGEEDDQEQDGGQSGESQDDDQTEGEDQNDTGDSDDGGNGDQSEDGDDQDDTEGKGQGDGEPSDDDTESDGDGDGSGDGEAEDGNGEGSGEGEGQPQPRGAAGDPGQCGEILDAAPEWASAEIAEAEMQWDEYVRQAVMVAKKATPGNLPGYLERIVEELDKPKLDPRELLRRFIDRSTSKDYSYKKPNRRHDDSDFIMPGFVPDRPNHIVLALDTSGSMGDDRIKEAIAEMQAVLDEGACDKVTVVYADTRVHGAFEYIAGDMIEQPPLGGGGTSFSATFRFIAEKIEDVSAIVYLTDMEVFDFGEKPEQDVLWIAVGDPRTVEHWAARAPFGETIMLGAF